MSEMEDILEVKAYKVNGKIYETEEEAERAQALNELKLVVEDFYFYGIDENGIEDALVDYRASLKDIFNRL